MERKVFKDSIEITVTNELKLFIRSMAASYQFIFQQEKYDLVQRAMLIDLVDRNGVGLLANKFATSVTGEKLELSKEEIYLLYTMMELVCRSFLCDVGDDYKAIAMKVNKVTEDRFNEVRNLELKIAQTLIQQIRRDFIDDPDFEEVNDRIELLDH
ncbi:MAG: hypothetical protein JNL88_10225 [Bacteroidia bacterium]|nr:hypothetical protein [Bacteroidia bacterium]